LLDFLALTRCEINITQPLLCTNDIVCNAASAAFAVWSDRIADAAQRFSNSLTRERTVEQKGTDPEVYPKFVAAIRKRNSVLFRSP
jgi:hypothetical protein